VTICTPWHKHHTGTGPFFTPNDGHAATNAGGLGSAIASLLHHPYHHHHVTTTTAPAADHSQKPIPSSSSDTSSQDDHNSGSVGGGTNNHTPPPSPASESTPPSIITPAPSATTDGSSFSPPEESSSSPHADVLLLSLDGHTYTANTAGAYVLTDGQTLTPGGMVTMGGDGEQISLGDGGSSAVVYYGGGGDASQTDVSAEPTDPWSKGASLMLATGGPSKTAAILPTKVPGAGTRRFAVREGWVVVAVGLVVAVAGV
jgi:hypothetical protein